MRQILGSVGRRCFSLIVCGVTVAGALLVSGCGESETAEVLAVSPIGSSEDGAVFGFGASLTLESLPATLELNDEQRSALAVALADLESARARFGSRMKTEGLRGPREGRRGGPKSGDATGFGGRGPLGGPPANGSEPPFMTFLASAAEILDRDQFVVLATYLAENRPSRPDRRGDVEPRGRNRGRHSDADGNRMGRWMAGRLGQEFGLSDDQIASVREAVSSNREQLRDLRAAVQDDRMSPEEALPLAVGHVAAMRSQLSGVLTAEQVEQITAHKVERTAEGVERRLANLDGRMVQRAELVSAALDMSEAQASQTEAIFSGTVAERSQLLSELRQGSVDPAVATFRILVIEQGAWAALEALLTPDQREAWEAMRGLLSGRRGAF